MIRLIQGHNRHLHKREMDELHRLRKRVFFERMGWEVPVIGAWEIDGYDALDPLYLACLDEREKVIGGLRLLPTMGLNMLNDTFSELLPDGKRVESPLIWESSRFAVDHEANVPITGNGIGRATAELGLGSIEVGELLGLKYIVTVYDAMLHRAMKRAGCNGDPLGEPKRIGKVMAYAVHFEVNERTKATIRSAGNIQGSVLETLPENLSLVA